MYPIRGPGTPLPGAPGVFPNTAKIKPILKSHILIQRKCLQPVTCPLFNSFLPTIHESNVVLPQPDAPKRP